MHLTKEHLVVACGFSCERCVLLIRTLQPTLRLREPRLFMSKDGYKRVHRNCHRLGASLATLVSAPQIVTRSCTLGLRV